MDVEGFHAFQLKFSAQEKCGHWLYCKEHKVSQKRLKQDSQKNVLFVLNVPPYADKEALQRFFTTHCGEVKSVYLHAKPNPNYTEGAIGEQKADGSSSCFATPAPMCFKVGYVEFDTSKSITKAMKLGVGENAKTQYVLSTPEHSVAVGMAKWMEEYNQSVQNEAELEAEVEEYMSGWDKEQEAKEEEERNKSNIDEDGWETVTRRGRKKGLARTDKFKDRVEKRLKKKKDKQELVNFYAFQVKETKMNRLEELRKKFEEDKKRVQQMKLSRRFRPY